MDLWMTSRTSPSVRFLRNEASTGGNTFVRFLLQASGENNRDALGARMVVEYMRNGTLESVWQTVRAGGSFISQSSKWLHFGIPHDAKIVGAKVVWPGGQVQRQEGLARTCFYVWKEGESPKPWTPPVVELVPGRSLEVPVPSVRTRTIVSTRPSLPNLHVKHSAGDARWLRSLIEEPTLVTLWSSGCPDCADEFQQLRNVPFPVLALNVDDAQQRGQQVTAAEALENWRFSGDSALLGQDKVAVLDFFQRSFFAVQSPLVLPTSFIVDAKGRVVALYRGEIDTKQVLSDLKLVQMDDEALLRQATPFRGRWNTVPQGDDPVKFARRLFSEGMIGAADRYLVQSILAQREDSAIRPVRGKEDLILERAGLHRRKEDFPSEIECYRDGLKILPWNQEITLRLGQLLIAQGQAEEAHKLLKSASPVMEKNSEVQTLLILSALASRKFVEAAGHAELALIRHSQCAALQYAAGLAYQHCKQLSKAVQAYEDAIRIDSGQSDAKNNLAWLRGTANDRSIRDLDAAQDLIRSLLKKTNDPSLLLYRRTAAAVCAASGDFDEAQHILKMSIRRDPGHLLVPRLKADLALYAAGRLISTIGK